MPEPDMKVDSPAVLLESAGHHRKTLFSLGEKEIRRAQNEKSKEYFSVVGRTERATEGLASLVGVLLKACSNFVQKTPPIFTFSEIERDCLGASRLGMVFPRENPSIFEGERKRPLGDYARELYFRFSLSETVENPRIYLQKTLKIVPID